MEQIGKLVFLEGFELVDEILNFLVAGVSVRDVGDFIEIGKPSRVVNFPEFSFPGVVGDKRMRLLILGVVCALLVSFAVDGDIISFAFNHHRRFFPILLVINCPPDQNIRPRVASPASFAGRTNFFVHLCHREAILIYQVANEFLPYSSSGISSSHLHRIWLQIFFFSRRISIVCLL